VIVDPGRRQCGPDASRPLRTFRPVILDPDRPSPGPRVGRTPRARGHPEPDRSEPFRALELVSREPAIYAGQDVQTTPGRYTEKQTIGLAEDARVRLDSLISRPARSPGSIQGNGADRPVPGFLLSRE
jgi:hypothetical protein